MSVRDEWHWYLLLLVGVIVVLGDGTILALLALRRLS